jgi:hypothetical protein
MKAKLTHEQKDDLVGTAVQLAYEYPDFGCAHVHDMYEAVCSVDGEPVYSEDDLNDWAMKARRLKQDDKSYQKCYEILMAE